MSNRSKCLISYYKPYKKLFFADMLCAFTVAAITLIYPLLIRYVTNDVLVNYGINDAMKIIIKLCVAIVFLSFLEFACNYFITYKGHMMGAKMEHDMRRDIFAHLQKMPFSFYDNQKTGQLMSRVTNDLFDITELCHHGPEDVVISVIKFVGAFIILMNINVWLTLIIFAILPFMFLFALKMKKKMHAASKKNRASIADVNASVEDSLSGIRVVASFANEDVEMSKFKKGNDRWLETKNDSYTRMGLFHSGLNWFMSIINAVMLCFGGIFIAKDVINVADLLTFILYVNNLIDPIKKLINFTEQFQNGITGFERFMEIMELEPDIKDAPQAKDAGILKGDITFNQVTFKYSEDKEAVLKNINLEIKAGSYVALVGMSGVGKTTMCHLIPRFYEPTSGNITIDGNNVNAYTLSSLRRNIGMVAQDVYLFAGTVMENVRYGKEDATEEEVIEACKNANAHEFIMNLPDGYNTYIGQRGIKLSGGQKQRLSIARVFLKNPSILIFDEATSALDNESEKIVKEALERLAKNRTTIVIAHRLSTIKNAETIVVLGEEGIMEQGSHRKLIEQEGVYASLYNIN